MTKHSQALNALKEVNFDWTMHLRSIWQDTPHDVSSLNETARRKLEGELDRLKRNKETNSPLGQVLIGGGGAGKTHLLGAVRRYAFSQSISFILVDMTDVHKFWETVLQGYVSSLLENGPQGEPQYKGVLEHLLKKAHSPISTQQLAPAPIPRLNTAVKAILSSLVRQERQKTIQFQDVIRALLLLNSDNFDAQDTGYKWLQGFEVDDNEKKLYEFSRASLDLKDIVEGLSWLMSLNGASVLAFDQLDAVVAQHHILAAIDDSKLSEEQEAAKAIAKSIIEELGGGLSALRDRTTKTLSLVSCLEATWTILTSQAIKTSKDRFYEPILLSSVLRKGVAEEIIKRRLQVAYQDANFSPPYETYPFSSNFFETAKRQPPRSILQRCEKHREQCIIANSVSELNSFGDEDAVLTEQDKVLDSSTFAQLDEDFTKAQSKISISEALEEKKADELLANWLRTACYCILKENPTTDSIDAVWEKDFSGGSAYPLLHGRIRLIFRDEQEREKHLCLRALQRKNAVAYQSRLRAAMTASGIDRRASSFRRLVIVRSHDVPGGAVTQKLTKSFREAGGTFGHPSEDEVRLLGAIEAIRDKTSQEKRNLDFERWLRSRRPISQLSFIRESISWLFEGTKEDNQNKEKSSEKTEKQGSSQSDEHNSSVASRLVIGNRLVGKQRKESISIPLQDLTKHAVALAGSGSGKTVLIKRIVEEAALLGIPAIVIDGANDLSQMGDLWDTIPESWNAEDKQKAERYHQTTEVLVWTPGRETANPVNLNPLPDFSAVADNPDELGQAIDMASASLQEIVATGKSQAAKVKQGILRGLLQYFAKSGGGDLQDLAELMSDAPLDEIGSYSNAQKRIAEMADLLNAQISTNPLLRQSGSPLDPAVLLGLEKSLEKTRISILNFIGLVGLEQQQQFLNQLAMTLFTWIKRNPAPTDQPLRGLLVIDEAKDFVPSRGSTPCKASINRLVAQARKYGLGIIFATQSPKSIDHNIIANCSTHFYGRANSPASIDVIKDQLLQRGGTGKDISKLPKGQFYIFSESINPPTKMSVPLCLSYHPATPPNESEVIKRAKASRRHLEID